MLYIEEHNPSKSTFTEMQVSSLAHSSVSQPIKFHSLAIFLATHKGISRYSRVKKTHPGLLCSIPPKDLSSPTLWGVHSIGLITILSRKSTQ